MGVTAVSDERRSPVSMGRIPALDGLRGVAILMVLGGHAGLIPGGGLGVDLFFALSGFVITALLLTEWIQFGHLDRRAFYRRRAVRLLPALAAMLILLCGLSLLMIGPSGVLVEAAMGAAYVMNVVQAVSPQATLFSHLWSLAEEEQFYLVWPLALAWALRRGTPQKHLVAGLAVVAGLAIADRATLALTGASSHRIWYAPDTHCDAVVLGCAAAVIWTYRLRQFRPIHGYAAAIVLVAVAASFHLDDRRLFVLPMAAFTVASAVVVGSIAENPDDALAKIMAWRPLQGLGKISYALYLWHLPLFVLGGTAVGMPLTLVAAAASYRYVERPLSKRWKHRLEPHRGHTAPARIPLALGTNPR
ncbi:MAG: acyltransferase family protein [Gaiellaceae bacterium]